MGLLGAGPTGWPTFPIWKPALRGSVQHVPPHPLVSCTRMRPKKFGKTLLPTEADRGVTLHDVRKHARPLAIRFSAARPPASSSVPHSCAPLETLIQLAPNGGGPPCEALRRAETCVTACDANHRRAQRAHLSHFRACCAFTRP